MTPSGFWPLLLIAALLPLQASAQGTDAGSNAGAASAASAAASEPPLDRERELARMRGERGLQVCRKSADGKLQYTGTTEGYERRQIKVLVSRIVKAETGEPVTGFRETNIWDDPANWSICS